MKREQRASGPRPRKALGQHFLHDAGVLADIAAAVGPPGTFAVEIGAGTGQLTQALLDAGHQVVAIEIEERLMRHLAKRFAGGSRLRLVQADARDIELASLVPAGQPFVVAGNLPYFAASFIIRRILEGPTKPKALVVTVQREVARELTAPPGSLSLLGVSALVFSEPEFLFGVRPEAFEPPPRVWSAVRRAPLVPSERLEEFFALVSRTFRHPRKQLHNALGLGPQTGKAALAAADIDPARRPETLTVPEWLRLLDAVRGVVVDG
jgi:16S rRNA (adenine1518-N6/adenine1519-N6)-dimethyltransferase